ncbi:hypothetical protein Tco_1345057 [Tanacetum coccineum]
MYLTPSIESSKKWGYENSSVSNSNGITMYGSSTESMAHKMVQELFCSMNNGQLKESPAERMSNRRKVQLKKVQLKDVQQMEGLADEWPAPMLEVANFTNWKKRFLVHIIGIEPQFKNIIENGPFIPMIAENIKPEVQWTSDERKAANLDQRLKSLILFVLPDDQMNSVVNSLTAKVLWDDLILYHEGPSNVKENRVMDLKLCYNTFKHKEGENLTQTFTRYKALMNESLNDGVILSKLEINTDKRKALTTATPLSTAFFSNSIVHDYQDSPDDEEDMRSSHFAKDCFSKTSIPLYSSPFQNKQNLTSNFQHQKPKIRPTKDFEAKYREIKARLYPLSTKGSSSKETKATKDMNKGLIAEVYDWDEEELSSDKNDMMNVKVLMALAEDEDAIDDNVVAKECARNGELVNITIKKVQTLLQLEDKDETKFVLDYLCIDLNYVEEQRMNLLDKYRNIIQELNESKYKLIELQQVKLNLLTLQHLNTEALKENQSLRKELKETTDITKSWLRNFDPPLRKVIQYQLLKDHIFPNHDTGRILPSESQTNVEILAPFESSATEDDSDKEGLAERPTLHPQKLSDLRKPIWYLDNRFSRHMIGVKNYMHKYVRGPGPKVVFGDDSTCSTEGYGSIKCNGIVFIKVAFVNGLKYNLISISQLCDAKYIVQFDEKRGTIFNSNHEVVMFALRVKDVYALDMTSTQETCFFARASERLN